MVGGGMRNDEHEPSVWAQDSMRRAQGAPEVGDVVQHEQGDGQIDRGALHGVEGLRPIVAVVDAEGRLPLGVDGRGQEPLGRFDGDDLRSTARQMTGEGSLPASDVEDGPALDPAEQLVCDVTGQVVEPLARVAHHLDVALGLVVP